MTEATKRPEIKAADLLDENHPVHKHFVKWLTDKEPSKRQARKFLQAFPKYREVN